MSPAATGGAPHTRAVPVIGGRPVSASNIDALKGGNRVYAHLDDLVGVKPDVDINWPLRKILQEADLFARQADTLLDFRRPDVALQEYIKATIVAVDVIPRHKDYPGLQLDRGELHRLYAGLTKRINGQHQKFSEVKETIKENNARNGTKSMASRIPPVNESLVLVEGAQNDHISSIINNNNAIPSAGPANKKAPPPIQPKPDALHGKTISPANGYSKTTKQEDLAARFAQLRPSKSSPVTQDPRIRTRPILVPDVTKTTPSTPPRNVASLSRAAGPKEMPLVPSSLSHPAKISLDMKFPLMPKLPDAVYSPDRGNESTMPNLKTSPSSFSSSTRKTLALPISNVGPTPLVANNNKDYFSAAHVPDSPGSPHASNKRKPLSLPESTTINAEELMELLKQGSQSIKILLVDVRSREDFEAGHIMSQSIICVEPLTLEHGISGEQLGDRMLLAPEIEQDLYEKRHEFDLIVAYDQCSTSLSNVVLPVGGQTTKLRDFLSAVYDYGYEKKAKQHPIFLVGGLDAWVDLLGPSSLQISGDGSLLATARRDGFHHKERHTPLRDAGYIQRLRKKTNVSRQLSKEEQMKWDSILRESSPGRTVPSQIEPMGEKPFNYVRTTEDFFRRYPELPSTQESMVSPVSLARSSMQELEDELTSLTPRHPARPAPALPRQRSSGISDRRLMVSAAHAAPRGGISKKLVKPGLTGLTNYGVTCYMNSTLQVISATVFLRDLLLNFTFPSDPFIPKTDKDLGSYYKKADRCLQLMVRCVGNLMGHLWCGDYHFVRPTTLLTYISDRHGAKNEIDRFGMSGRSQHDVEEFSSWLFAEMESELNPRRLEALSNERTTITSDQNKELAADPLTLTQHTIAYNYLLEYIQGPIAHAFRYVLHEESRCSACKYTKNTWEQGRLFTIQAIEFKTSKAKSLQEQFCLLYSGRPEKIPESRCTDEKNCGKVNTTTRVKMVSHFADYLQIYINRTAIAIDGKSYKEQVHIPLGGTEWDLSSCLAPGSSPDTVCMYDVYAVVHHLGSEHNGGHYTVMTRSLDKPPGARQDEAGSWHYFNDQSVVPLGQAGRRLDQAMATVFLRKRGVA